MRCHDSTQYVQSLHTLHLQPAIDRSLLKTSIMRTTDSRRRNLCIHHIDYRTSRSPLPSHFAQTFFRWWHYDASKRDPTNRHLILKSSLTCLTTNSHTITPNYTIHLTTEPILVFYAGHVFFHSNRINANLIKYFTIMPSTSCHRGCVQLYHQPHPLPIFFTIIITCSLFY